ncbi:hypothetical protein EHF33_20755 (plasmid) [Deinococcus psychrotolerans]|uniref:Phage tail tape measure protein domain-containing protein n=1 Tax=Deinococcus psychrotolerans TaxID=2489213 RepID=A0A3G8YK72_9DEIO|nr:phage tail tape measure protein [Deinococcus psychrotolerans]AZI45343.1 hypothetical protein EHF33_20755 [Deinococcus psychrotolerans]
MESRTVSYLLQAKTSGNEQIKIMGDELSRVKLLLGEFGAQSAGIRTITEELSRSATNARLVRGELEQVRQAGQSMATPLVTALNELNTKLDGFIGKQRVVLQTVEKLDSGVTVAARGVGILNSQMQRGAIGSELWGKQTGVLIGVLKGAANETGVFSKEAQLLERSLKSAAAVNFKNQMGAAGQAVKTVNVARLDWQGGVGDEKTLATLAQLEKGYRATQKALQSEMDTLKSKASLDEGEMARVRQLTALQEKYGQAIRNIGAVQASISGGIQKGSLADSMVRANQTLAEAKLRTDALVASQKSGELTSKELASALNSQVISLKNSLIAIRAKIAGMESLGTMDVTQREQLNGLILAEREYAAQVLKTAAAQKEAAAAGSARRAFAGGAGLSGNLGNAGMALGMVSPEAGMAGMALSMGPVVGGMMALGMATGSVIKLTKDGQQEAKKLQQAFLVMSANGITNLDGINKSLNDITKNGSDAEKMFSKSELATALASLARGGVKGADALKVLGVSAKLAAAEHIPLSEATERLYGNLQHLDMTADQASGFGDKLARASHLSMASMDGLSKGLNVVGATAHLMGFSTEESLGALVRLAQKGMDPASVGATGLRNAMQKVLTPSATAAGIYKELGVNMRDSTGHMRSGRDIVMDLQKTFSSTRPIYNQLTGDIITKNDLAQKSFQIFGTRSATAFLNILGNLGELTEEIRNSSGFLNTYSGEVVSGLEGSQKRLDAATKNLSSTFAKAFTPALADVVVGATSVVTWIDKVSTSMSDARINADKFGNMKIKADDNEMVAFLKIVNNWLTAIEKKTNSIGDWFSKVGKSTGLSNIGDGLASAMPALGSPEQNKMLDQRKQLLADLGVSTASIALLEQSLEKWRAEKDAKKIAAGEKMLAQLQEQRSVTKEMLADNVQFNKVAKDPNAPVAPAAAAQNGKETAQQFIASMTKNVTGDPKIAAWCADVVSQMLSELGQKVKYSNNAAQLERNIKAAGGVPIALKDAKQGDAVFWHGIDPSTGRPYGAKSGTHTEMFAGWNNGKAMLVGSNTSARMTGKNFYDQNQATVYRLPAPGEHPQGPPAPVAANSKPDIAGLQNELDTRARTLYAAWIQTKASGNADPKILAEVATFKKEHKLLWSKIVEDAKVAAKELKAAGVSDADYAKWIAPAQRMAQLQKSTRVGGDTQRKADNQINAWVKASGGDSSAAKKVFDYEVGALSRANQGAKEYIANTAELNQYRAEATGIAQRQADASKSQSDTAIAASKREVADFIKDSKVKGSVLGIVTESLKNQQAAEQQAAKVKEAAQAGDVTLAQQELTRLTSQRDTKVALAKDSASKRLQYEKDYAQSVYAAGVALADAQYKQAKANANNPNKTDPANRVQALQVAENDHTQALQKALDERNARTSSASAENLAEQRKYSDASKQLDIDSMTSSASRLKQLNDAKLESVKDNLTKVSSLTKGFAKNEYDRQVAIAAATRDKAITAATVAGGPNQQKTIDAAKTAYDASETSARLTRDKAISDAKKAALDQQKVFADASKQLDIETMNSSSARLKGQNAATLEAVKDNLVKKAALTKQFADDEYTRSVKIAQAERDRAVKALNTKDPNYGQAVGKLDNDLVTATSAANITRNQASAAAQDAVTKSVQGTRDSYKTLATGLREKISLGQVDAKTLNDAWTEMGKLQEATDKTGTSANTYVTGARASAEALRQQAIDSAIASGAFSGLVDAGQHAAAAQDALAVSTQTALDQIPGGVEARRAYIQTLMDESKAGRVGADTIDIVIRKIADLNAIEVMNARAADEMVKSTLDTAAAFKSVGETDMGMDALQSTLGMLENLSAAGQDVVDQINQVIDAINGFKIDQDIQQEVNDFAGLLAEMAPNMGDFQGSADDLAGALNETLGKQLDAINEKMSGLTDPARIAAFKKLKDSLLDTQQTLDNIYANPQDYQDGARGFGGKPAPTPVLDDPAEPLDNFAQQLEGVRKNRLKGGELQQWLGTLDPDQLRQANAAMTVAHQEMLDVQTAQLVAALDRRKQLSLIGEKDYLVQKAALDARGIESEFVKATAGLEKTDQAYLQAVATRKQKLDALGGSTSAGLAGIAKTDRRGDEDRQAQQERNALERLSTGKLIGEQDYLTRKAALEEGDARRTFTRAQEDHLDLMTAAKVFNAAKLKIQEDLATQLAGISTGDTRSIEDANASAALATLNAQSGSKLISQQEFYDQKYVLDKAAADRELARATADHQNLEVAQAKHDATMTALDTQYRSDSANLSTAERRAFADAQDQAARDDLDTQHQQLLISESAFIDARAAQDRAAADLALQRVKEDHGNVELAEKVHQTALRNIDTKAEADKQAAAGLAALKNAAKSASDSYNAGSSDLLSSVQAAIKLAQQADLAAKRATDPAIAQSYRDQAAAIRSQLGPLGAAVETLMKVEDYAKAAQQAFSLFGQDDWAKSAADVADGIGSTMQAVGGIGKVATGDLSGIKDIIFGALNAVNSFGNALLNLDPKYKLWKKNLLEIAAIEQKNLGEKQVGNSINPYFDQLQTDIENRTKTANATVWQKIGWWAFGGAPKIMSDEAAKSLAKMSGLFNDYAGSLGDVFRSAVGDAFSSGDWGKASANLEKSFDVKVGNMMIAKLADLQLKALNLDADIKAWAEAMDAGDYSKAAAINNRIKAKISTAFNSPALQNQINSLPGAGANKPVAGSVAEKDTEISDLQDRQKKATSKGEYDDLQSKIDKLTKQRESITGTTGGNSSITDPAQQRQRDELWNNYNKETDPTKKAAYKKQLDQATGGGSSGTTTITLLPSKDQIDQVAYIKGLMDSAGMQVQAGNIQLDAAKRQQDAAGTMVQAAGMILLAAQGQGVKPGSGRTQF